MNIVIDKNLKKLSKELNSRGFHVKEIDYTMNYESNAKMFSKNNNEKADIYIYFEDVFKANYYSGVNSKILNSFIPNDEGALLINACNKTIEQIIYIIEARVYSPIFTEGNSFGLK
jgi:uncharacterized protein (UPF0335 family)